MNLRHITLLALLFCATTTMYAQENDVDENEVGFTEERPNYGQGFHAHRYALQRPNIAKRFEKKVLGDRLFVDFGLGVTLPFSASENSKNGFVTGVSVGDWLTPEHGVRAGIKVGNYTYGKYDITLKGVTLDYLINLSALTTYGKTYEKKKFEVLGIAGWDFLHRSHGSSSSFGVGVHFGARAQYGIPNSIFQIYAEPRLYFMDAREQALYTNNMYKSGAEMLFGLSILPYQRVIPTGNQADLDNDGHFLNNTFVYFAGGPQALLSPLKGSMTNTLGARMQGGIGKWFKRGFGARLTAYANFLQEPNVPKNKGLGIAADAMVDLTYLNEGYNPHRRFWINGLLGASLALHKHEGVRKTITYGFGAGLQPNFRLTEGISFFLEPRVDVFNNKNYIYGPTTNSWAVVPSLLGGVNFMQGGFTKEQRETNANYAHETPYDHMFIEGATGLYFAGETYRNLWNSPAKDAHIKFYGAIGKWFNATSGMRIWTDVNKPRKGHLSDHQMTAGIDYLWNMTNTFHGYDPNRKVELHSSLGFNVLKQKNIDSFTYGVNAGVRAQWNASKMIALFVEPQVRVYKEDVVRNNYTTMGYDFVPVGLFGMQLRFNGYSPATEKETYIERDYDHYFSVAGGLQAILRKYNKGSFYGPIARLSFGKHFTPISSYRLHGLISANKIYNRKYAMAGVGADYMVDLTAMAYGYNEDRKFTLSGILGATANVSYQSGPSVYFYPEVYAGGQAAFRISDRFTFFYEPQLRYDFTDQMKHAWDTKEMTFTQRLSMVHLLGMNMKFETFKKSREEKTYYHDDDKREFFSVAGGLQVPLRRFNISSFYGPSMRFSYGKQSSPFWLYRFNVGMEYSNINWGKERRSVIEDYHFMRASVGADLMLDYTAWAYGYNPDRRFTLRPFIGLAASAARVDDRYSDSKPKMYYYPDLSAGAQVGLRVSKNIELYYEGQVKYSHSDQIGLAFDTHETTTLMRMSTAHMLGLNYRFTPMTRGYRENAGYERPYKQFVSISAGTNLNTATSFYLNSKLGLSTAISYGRWLNGVLGFRVGLDNTQFKAWHNGEQQHWTSLHADVLCDLRTVLTNDVHENKIMTCNAFAGVGLGISRMENFDTKFAPMLNAGIQIGANIGKHFNVYIEPSAQLFEKGISQFNTDHPFEATGKIMLGTKYNF